MRAFQIRVRNFIGARDVNIEPAAPVVVIAGDNEAGKSSICEAIKLAFTGEMSRVDLKKDYSQVVTDGATSGLISVRSTAGDASFEVPTGRWGEDFKFGDEVTMPSAIRYVLEPSRFAAMDVTDRRRFLILLTGKTLSSAEIQRRLGARGINETVIAKVLAKLKEGSKLDAISTFASSEARDLKGQWREVTGEAYGDKKAASWKMDPVNFDADGLARSQAKLKSAQANLDAARTELGRIKGVVAAAEAQRKQLADLRASLQCRADLDIAASKADDDVHFARDAYNAACTEMNRISAEVEAATKELTKAPAPKRGKKAAPTAPPDLLVEAFGVARGFAELIVTTLSVVDIKGEALPWDQFEVADANAEFLSKFAAAYPDYVSPDEQHEEAPAPVAAPAEVDPALLKRRTEAARKVQTADDKLREAEDVARIARSKVDALAGKLSTLQELEAKESAGSDQHDVAGAEVEVKELQNEVDGYVNQVRFHEAAKTQADAAVAKTKRAGELHADILGWIETAAALSPDGLSAEILAEALAPLNEALATVAAQSKWPVVTIGADMAIRYGNRRYELCAESGKWRADAALAAMIATVSGIRFIMLDRIDVNSVGNRMALLKWLHAAIQAKTLDGAVLLGTMKEAPVGLPAQTFTSVWLEKGRTGAPLQAAAA